MILENLAHVETRIQEACRKAGRSREEVKLMLATKTVPASVIKDVVQSGVRLIGENKVQEAKQKYEYLQSEPIDFHFIGHLQRNKVKDVIRFASCIQSIDRMDLCQALDKELQKQNRSMDILVQVNTSHEPSKFGIKPEETIAFIETAAAFKTLRVKGLMTIGLFSADPHLVRPCFTRLREIHTAIKALHIPGVSMDILSMGMSSDFELAIEEGSTLVRVGTAIFGKRIYPDSYYWNEAAQS